MYAIVEIAGQQFKVEKDQEIFVHRLEGEAGSSIELDQVLLVDKDGDVSVGTPVVDGILIKAKIVEHLKGDKVIVFHKKRRKGYQKQNGHRQYLSKVVIEDIVAGKKKAAEKKAEVKEEKKSAPKAETKKATPKAEKKTAPKAEKETAPKAEKKETPKAEAKKDKAPKAATKKKSTPKAEVKKEDSKPAEKTKKEEPKTEKE